MLVTAAARQVRAWFREVAVWGSLVKFPHTVFALPFALSMLVVAARQYPFNWQQFLWILSALVSARTAAMSYNRLIDFDIDQRNPRTRQRELPSGTVTAGSVKLLLLGSSAVFALSSLMLGWHCFVLFPLVLGIVLFYSWTKRFTSCSHLVLGLSLALAPGGVWYAITARAEFLPVVLMVAVLLWVAGFDILYSCQDVEFDRGNSLHSLPARIGIPAAFAVSRMMHLATVALLIFFGLMAGLGAAYFMALVIFAMVLASQHFLLNAADLSRINEAFFVRNGVASIVFFLGVLVDYLVGSSPRPW